MECPECERLRLNEESATVEFVAADKELPPDPITESDRAEGKRIKQRKLDAIARLEEARRLRAEHEGTHRKTSN